MWTERHQVRVQLLKSTCTFLLDNYKRVIRVGSSRQIDFARAVNNDRTKPGIPNRGQKIFSFLLSSRRIAQKPIDDDDIGTNMLNQGVRIFERR